MVIELEDKKCKKNCKNEKRDVMVNGIPFSMTLPKELYVSERGYCAMVEICKSAEKNGSSNMSLEEINAEINISRNEIEQ